MSPALHDDESLNQGKTFTTKSQGSRRSTSNSTLSVANRGKVEAPEGVITDENDKEEADGELEDEFFIVETIKNHFIDEDVKWEGFDSKNDLTWEPEDNLKVSGDEILNEYFDNDRWEGQDLRGIRQSGQDQKA
ncbi:hypothetical protein BFJ68_g17472 [Fusarium oxysporum]|uniref:Chromo domain-containing protein n=1 Tax=Fusarium oxysporum TaxID=5507 RepID=A0A420NS52_FUSOX|nr:hypothetical protein DER44DRAFT_833951 [Fusarium oxysporum]RKK83104.1 hypothetical protein BFJ68_g17472 [Fusarium oxysporum]